MKPRVFVLTLAAVFAALPVFAAEATFDRTFTLTSRADLTVATGSGTIRISAGPAGRIHVSGHIRSTWGSDTDAKVRDLAAHPPVEQTGNIVRIGVHTGNLHNIAIDYDVQAPADSYLQAQTGSGSIDDQGVGVNSGLSTGSGNVRATGLNGDTKLETGSGSLYAEFAGPGNVKAETGSGSIELRNVHGGLRAQAGSGRLNIGGTPSAAWQIETGSGSVDFWPGNSGFDLEAECGSGGIHSDRDIGGRNRDDKHQLSGKVNGGGPLVRIQTGSGSIRIH